MNQKLLRGRKSYTRLGLRWAVTYQMLWLNSIQAFDPIRLPQRFGLVGAGRVQGHARQAVSEGAERCLLLAIRQPSFVGRCSPRVIQGNSGVIAGRISG